MSKAKLAPFAMHAGLTMALAVSASFTHVAASPSPTSSAIEATKEVDLTGMHPADKAKLREQIKITMAGLRDMNQFLARSCKLIMSGEHIPQDAIESEPFTAISQNFRNLELGMASKWADFADMPIIGQETMALRKALATARSRAAQNSMLLKQRYKVLTETPSDVDMQGLQKLTAMSSERLLKLVG